MTRRPCVRLPSPQWPGALMMMHLRTARAPSVTCAVRPSTEEAALIYIEDKYASSAHCQTSGVLFPSAALCRRKGRVIGCLLL